ncbi:MAG TPA: hypothetical protein VM534_09595 [Thermoanaerobaculia bacterium]|nr:hypothetical protein [Thermoanaerobaculia bacterium]
MGEEVLFQICYEGDLTVEVCDALRRLRAEPNFDQSWQVRVEAGRHAALLVRYLRMRIGGDSRLLVAETDFSRTRDFLLVRHSQTPGADYRELHDAIARLGRVLDLPFEATFVIAPDRCDDVHLVGEALAELCPDASLMVMGTGHDLAFCTGAMRRMYVPGAGRSDGLSFRPF